MIGDILTVDEYCNQMCQDGVWGGMNEIHALAKALKFNVFIHELTNVTERVFNMPYEEFEVLHISLHKGDHFNSIRRGDDPMEKYESPIRHFPIGYDLQRIQTIIAEEAKKNKKYFDHPDLEENHLDGTTLV